MGTRGKGGSRRRAGAPGAGASTGSRARAKGRARGRGGASSGAWLAAAVAFLALMGVGGFVLFHGGGATSARAQDAASPSASTAVSASASPSCGPEAPDSAFPSSGAKAKPLDVRVTVLNGSGTFGQAETVLSWMQNTEKYLRTSNGGPAAHNQPDTTLVYAPDHADQARTLVAALGLPASALHGEGTASGARDPMVLTLGADFHGIGKPFSHC
ncbi:LytR C-terminal domain-containing protein [Streptacidiphilus pinicola]|uniref:LytR C-terminal domain-containing protein n=1 Tax=Streptacidiphilus pinicola TaxID=2219663 RepID=UPI001FB4F06D|nr:LytR C-terminal domain-containing protein [Streptacidiphilus pinicola]